MTEHLGSLRFMQGRPRVCVCVCVCVFSLESILGIAEINMWLI